MKSATNVNGFTLLEVIPSLSLFAVFSTISFNILLLVMQFQERSDYQEYLGKAFQKVTDTWSGTNGTVAICRLNNNREWEVLEFPSESWLPGEKHSGRWTCWRKRTIYKENFGVSRIEYLDSLTGEWIRWSSILEIKNNIDGQS